LRKLYTEAQNLEVVWYILNPFPGRISCQPVMTQSK
jgi:hypothetical protein